MDLQRSRCPQAARWGRQIVRDGVNRNLRCALTYGPQVTPLGHDQMRGSMGFEAPSQLHGGDRVQSFNFGTARAPCEEPIGAPLERARVRLAALLSDLDGRLGEHATPLLQEARRQLEERACRIAVIGQIKAGKTTFINTLIGQPGLLPTDINPWTAVVSALHFRDGRKCRALGCLPAVLRRRMEADRQGRRAPARADRTACARVPAGSAARAAGSDAQPLRATARRQVRAAARQGASLQGRSRPSCWPTISAPGIRPWRAAPTANARNYSDITRSADLYFNESPFAFPITLIDTPGTNDPFLVRDEITRRSLENPDIYIFVVSALQPLSAADIAMMRLLNGLHKDRIVVFINRVDQLANPMLDATVVRRAVKKRLRLEFPSLHIPVIIGSAWLGGMGNQPPAAVGDEIASTFAAHPMGVEPAFPALAARGAAPLSNGMAEVSEAITHMMCNSTIAVLLQQIAGCLLELVRSDQAGVSAQLRQMQTLFETERTEASTLQKKIEEEGKSLAAFEERALCAAGLVHGDADPFQPNDRVRPEHHAQRAARHRARLRAVERGPARRGDRERRLHEVLAVQCHAAAQRPGDCLPGRIRRARQRRRARRAVPLSASAGDRLQPAACLPGYGARGALGAARRIAVARAAVRQGDDGPRDALVDALDQGAPFSAEDHGNQLRLLIENDFLPIVDQLVGDAVDCLCERVEYTMQRANAITSGLLSGVEQRRENLAVEAAPLKGAGDAQSAARREHEQVARIQKCMERQATLIASCEELGNILTGLNSLQVENARR